MPELKQYDQSMQQSVEAFFAVCFPLLGWDYEPNGRHSDIVHIDEAYMHCGMFWCLFDYNDLIGTVAVRSLDEINKSAEMKRLYLLPEYQGKGYGDLLFRTALNWTTASGFQILRLDTQKDSSAARHLIEKHRFRRIKQYNQNALADLFYELNLDTYDLEE